MLEVRSISCSYRPGHPVLDGVTHAFAPGTLTALIGPNGAGKSTLLKAMLGVVPPARGQVLLDQQPVEALSAACRAARMAYVPQRSEMLFPFTVREMVSMAVTARTPSEAVDEAIDQADLRESSSRTFLSLSAGQQQRALMARAMVQVAGVEPAKAVLLADEPVAAMDPRHAVRTLERCAAFAASGATVVVVLHDLHMACAFATHAVLLGERGRIEASGPIAEAVTADTLSSLYGAAFTPVTDRRGVRSFMVDLLDRG